MKYEHIPVLTEETIKYLNIRPNGIYFDSTLGGGGHAKLILDKLNSGKLIGVDQDIEAIKAAEENLKDFSNVIYIKDNFKNLKYILNNLQIEKVDGILLDLGVSSYQLDKIERGFSYSAEAQEKKSKLDMRMDLEQSLDAIEVINSYSEKELADLFFHFGEEPFARRIARKIVEEREQSSITTVSDLVDIIRIATPPKYRYGKNRHFASKIFRAIRMEVNDELGVIKEVIPQAIGSLNSGGRLVIITFNSLEDRIVKHLFREFAEKGDIKILTKKPIIPSEVEIEKNIRSESAKLRAIEKVK